MAITFISPAEKKHSGGVKVLYRHSEILAANGFESYIFHPKYPNFSCDWFAHNVAFRKIKSKTFNLLHRNKQMKKFKESGYHNDFIVIPEIWAANYGLQCLENGFSYAIFVQNGYFILNGKEKFEESTLKTIYEQSNCLLSISEDTTNIISLAYPTIQTNKIIRLLPNIGPFFPNRKKEKIITYMPRKLPDHAAKVCFYLKEHLPKDWQIMSIENKNEQDVAEILSKSSIFMSFSDQEGFSLPPIEAAFAGNIVVGYTGQGAKEYFKKPLFREVYYGDFTAYIKNTLLSISDIEKGIYKSGEFTKNIKNIKNIYSKKNELNHLINFAMQVKTKNT